jgi:hypothetical protein
MTKEQKQTLDSLKDSEIIISMSYWENFKYYKDLCQGMGANHPMSKRAGKCCEEIRSDWHVADAKIKEFLRAIGEDGEEKGKELIFHEG